MTQQRQILADALERIRAAAKDDVIRTKDMSRTDRERAQAGGWLHLVIKGWYLVGSEASGQTGETVLWYSHFWQFVRRYLDERFAAGYCLNAEASLDLHVGATTVPRQLIVMTCDGGAHTIQLPHDTSIQSYPDPNNLPDQVAIHEGMRVMPLPTALCRVTPRYFSANPVNAEIALNMVNESELSRTLIAGRNTRAASRLMGAYQFLGNEDRARRIKQDMQVSVSRISPVNPFDADQPLLGNRPRLSSPQVGRLVAMWAKLRPAVIDGFPDAGIPASPQSFLADLEDIYQHDAYNSLSIEGYRVTPQIIQRVRSGNWVSRRLFIRYANTETARRSGPLAHEPSAPQRCAVLRQPGPAGRPPGSRDPDREEDREHVAAMAARGYFDAFAKVKGAVARVLGGENPAAVAEKGIQDWYRALFGPSVQASILDAVDLAGFRNRPVFISGSSHVPPPADALMDCMETLFGLLADESSAAARAVLGHFTLVFIHPYPDGNGRLGRFLMNLMLASGGYPWTVIRLSRRDTYLQALEQASVKGDICPFVEFVVEEMKVDWAKEG